MAILINDNYSLQAIKPFDARYLNISTPWASVGAANAGIPTYRYTGLTVNILGSEYWYKDGVADINLVEKESSIVTEGITGATNGLTRVGQIVILGGALTGDTLIETCDYGIVFGFSGTTATGCGAFAIGSCTTASGKYSHAEGYGTEASGNFSHAESYATEAIGDYSHAEGLFNCAIGDYSHAEGYNTFTCTDYSHAEGCEVIACGEGSHAEGYKTIACSYGSHAEGKCSNAIGDYSHAEGL